MDLDSKFAIKSKFKKIFFNVEVLGLQISQEILSWHLFLSNVAHSLLSNAPSMLSLLGRIANQALEAVMMSSPIVE